ncbi:hypothetical protein B9Z55_012213 [Caenorhabditis nigoni]|nr:hypothetical protein B9Z55_012213 [Caenorhabditis nigoni]
MSMGDRKFKNQIIVQFARLIQQEELSGIGKKGGVYSKMACQVEFVDRNQRCPEFRLPTSGSKISLPDNSDRN